MRTGLILALLLSSSISGGQGRQPAPAAPSGGEQVVFLGTAGGPPLRLDRAEPSTLLLVAGRSYLIDCGVGVSRRRDSRHGC